MAANGDINRPGSVGILTRGLIRSPVTYWLLHARLRHRSLNDVVFVGDDFVHVRQVGPTGNLEHIATKDDFDARIQAANVLSIDPDPLDEDFLVKREDANDPGDGIVPSDLLVLTLTTHDIIFLYLEVNRDGQPPHFVHQTCPLPVFDRILFQPGEHVAVDVQSRALAVAAHERQIILYTAKSQESLANEIRRRDNDWCPVTAQRPLLVDGVIQHIAFLPLPEDDEDHILLLVIVVDQRKTKAILVEWYHTATLHDAQQHPAIPLFPATTVSSLLIPLRNADFLIFTGDEIRRYTNVLAGSISGTLLQHLEADPEHDGDSPLRPVWTNWCRPVRSRARGREKDDIYLVREDGLVKLLYAMVEGSVTASSAGHLRCHVGTAFASLGRVGDPDILAVAGVMSTGHVVSIGQWPATNGRVEQLDWSASMEMGLIQTVPNWASATDMLTSTLPQSHGRSTRSRDGVFLTSGRQPYGSITELRYGLETRLTHDIEISELRAVTDIWAVPRAANGALLLLMATPSTTLCFELKFDHDSELVPHDVDEATGLNLDHRTLAAACMADGHIIQITETGVYITADLVKNFEDTTKHVCKSDHVIIAAAIDADNARIVTAERQQDRFSLCSLILPQRSTDAVHREHTECIRHTSGLSSAPLSVAVLPAVERTFAVAATTEHGIIIFSLDDARIREECRIVPPTAQDTSSLCDHLVLLSSTSTSNILVLGGLRDGYLVSALLTLDEDGAIQCVDRRTTRFGNSTVKLVGLAERPDQACILVGPDTCLLSWDGQSAQSLTIESLWVSDKAHPELAQGTVSACTQFPASDLLSSTALLGSFAMVSEDRLLIGDIGAQSAAVPRHIPVSGTPNRLIYADQQRSLVVASLQTALRSFPAANGKPEARRQVWPTIDFIPSRSSEPCHSYDMQPGERVYTLLEWSYTEGDKTYSFILVGGSYVKRNGSQGGKIRFLQPNRTGWDVTSVKEGPVTRFEAPVFALALYDPLTYVVCYGRHVRLYRFSSEDRRWGEVCPPLGLTHSGTYVTVEDSLIYVTTSEDSLVTLQLEKAANDDDEAGAKLVAIASSPRADRALSHLLVHPRPQSGEQVGNIALLSTKDCKLVGLSARSALDETPTHSMAEQLLFEAHLPRSITRLRRTNIRPAWKFAPPEGIIVDDVVGVASDGTLVGVAILNESLWRRLAWLQRLCEWNEVLSPHSYQTPLYNATDTGYARDERALPIGISSGTGGSETMLRTSVDRGADKHINGDVLARLLQRGGAEVLRRIIRQLADQDDHAGEWTREHLQEELAAADEIIEILRAALDCWM